MKKLLFLLLIPVLALLLASCGEKEEITLTYSNWNMGDPNSEDPSMERMMIEAFMEKYPHIKVEIVERPKIPGTTNDMAWPEFLASRASTEQLPDVYMAADIPYYIIQDWVYNLTDIASKDEEFMNISEDIRSVITYNGKIMAVPCQLHYAGYVVNETLYEEQGQDFPTVDSTFEQLITLTKAAANHSSTTNTGVAGLEGIEHIIHWYPAQLNTDFQWFTLNEDGFNLDSEDFEDTMEFYRTLQTDTSFVLDALQYEANKENSTIVIEDIFPEGNLFDNGAILCKFFYSWDFGRIQSNINNGLYTWDMDFIGTPFVNGNKRVPIVADFFTVSKNTKHPEEAFLLAKWMGFGKDGYLKRVELSKTVEGIPQVNFAPLQDDDELLDAYFELYPNFLGLRTIIERGTFIVEPPKYLPGYNTARYQGTYDAENKMGDIINKLRFGEVIFGDIKTELNNRANALYDDAREDFDNAIALR